MLKRIFQNMDNIMQKKYRYVFVLLFAVMLIVILLQCLFVYYEFQNVLYENFYYFANNSVIKARIETETICRELTNISVHISNDYSTSTFWHVNQQHAEEDIAAFMDNLNDYKYVNYIEEIYLYNERNNMVYSESIAGYEANVTALNNTDIQDILQNKAEGTTKSFAFYFYPSQHYYYAKNAYFAWYPFSNSDNAVLFQLNFDVFEKAFTDILLLENSSFWIIDGNGQQTYGNITLEETELNSLMEQLQVGKVYGFTTHEGHNELFISSYSEILDQYFVAQMPQDEMLYTENFERQVQFLIVLIAVFFIIVVLVAVLVHVYGRELARLNRSVKKMYNDMIQKKELKWEQHARVLFSDSARCDLSLLSKLGFNFEFENQIYLALANITASREIFDNKEDRELYKYGVVNIVCECVSEFYPTKGIRMDDEEIVFLVSAPSASPDEILDLFENAANHTKRHLQIDFMLLVSEVIDNYYDIDQVYANLRHLVNYRYLYGKSFKCTARILLSRKESNEEEIQSNLKLLSKKMRASQIDASKLIYEEIKNDIFLLPVSKVKTNVLLLTNVLCEALRSAYGSSSAKDDDLEEYNIITNTMHAEYIPDVWNILDRVYEEITSYVAVGGAARHADVGLKVKKLIVENYNNPNLGLTYIADAVGLSSGYVSKIFKDYMHMTIPNYILQFRLKKVSEFLSETDMPLDELASKSGFGSTRYLYYVFKKQFNMTPVAYRRQKHKEKGEQQDE